MNLPADLRFSLRRLAHAPGFAAATVLMLALGIGLSVAMYSVVHGVLLASLPYPDSERVVVLGGVNREQAVEGGGITPAEALALAQATDLFDEVGYYTWGGLTVFDGERPRELTTVSVAPGFFSALGVTPLLGRWFGNDDYQAGADVVILSEAEWRRHFGDDRELAGKTVETSNRRLRVIGVMPDAFATPSAGVAAWRPHLPSSFPSDQPWHWNARFVNAVAKLPAGASAAALQPRLDALAAQVRERFGMADQQWRLSARPVLDTLVGDVRGVLWGGMAIALLVLLIACANVALLVDARQISRRHEQAVAQAIGATRGRVLRAMLLELALLSLLAAVAGSALAWLGIDALRELAAGNLPRSGAIVLRSEALWLALGLGLLAPFVAAVAGTLQVRGEAAEAIRAGGKGVLEGHGRRRWLPALGIALCTVGLVAASALVLSLIRLQQVDPGFRSERVHAMQLFVDGGAERWRQVAGPLRERLRALPGVDAVALTTAAPLAQIGAFAIDLKRPQRAQPEPFQVGLRRVGPGYLELLGIPLLGGRGIGAEDRDGSEPVAVINRELARRAFGSDSPLGQTVQLPLGDGERVPFRVVGVMEDIRNNGLRSPPEPELLIAYDQLPWVGMTFLVKSADAGAGLEAQMAEALWEIAPREAITRAYRLHEDLDAQAGTVRFFVRTIGVFALCALILAALGVYAVAAQQQQQRRNEFGLRLALGARPRELAAQILRDGLTTAGAGVALGAFGGWLALRLLRSQLFEVAPLAPEAFAVGVLVLLGAAVTASAWPALRAARTDPMASLRHD